MQTVIKNFVYTGATQTFNVPLAVGNIFIQAWGAAGGSTGRLGGPGGYSQGDLSVVPGDTLSIIVGQGGTLWNISPTAARLATFGGGGGGGPTNEPYVGSSGGGRAAVLNNSGIEVLTAGGGGGSDGTNAISGVNTSGGPGGGLSGLDAYINVACYTIAMGKGGTQTAGGDGGQGFTAFNNGASGTQFSGGTGGGGSNGGPGAGSAGGGGGGYYGGGGGAGEYASGSSCPLSAGAQDCAAGGGSGYIDGVNNGYTVASATPGTSPFNPPGTTLPNYVSGVGVARLNTVGGNGLIILTYSLPTLVKYVDKTIATIGDVLNYTLVLDNVSGVTLNNIVLLDTTPNGTTFVPNSLFVNGNAVSGSPDSPGANLGNISSVITITYSVLVTTVPSPNPIVNNGTISATNLNSLSSNSVSTKINYTLLSANKIVNKQYANIGDILTYTIPISNKGNATLLNILFIDTIPDGTNYIAGSLNQDGIAISGSSNPPGVTLPNPVNVGKVSTITFKVQITTIPSPNPIPNIANFSGSYLLDPTTIPNIYDLAVVNTNYVYTQVNNATLVGITKSVDKNYTTCGNVLTYTITVPNSGNTTAYNVTLKDTIPNGTVLVPNSVFVNGSQLIGGNPITGISMPNIGPGSSNVVTFQVLVQC